MKSRISVFFLVLFLACGTAIPQKKPRRPVSKTTKTFVIEPLNPEKKRPAPYQINLKIAEGPEFFVSIVSSFGPDDMSRKDIASQDLDSFVSRLANGHDANGDAVPAIPNVSVEASPRVTMRDLWKALEIFPPAKTNISIFIPPSSIPSGRMLGGMTLAVPGQNTPPGRNLDVKPNPLLLVVTLDDKDRLALNNEPAGSLSNPEPLVQRLLEIFKAREVNGVFAEGTNSIEKTVSIVLPASGRTVSQLMTITEAVKSPGAGPINLMMESPLNTTIDDRKELLILPTGIPPRP